MSIVLGILLVLSSFFLIVLVLIQQGRGGGLAGAFGGMGGQSAFGTKAGDLFTRITIVVAAVWILLCVATVKWASSESSPFSSGLGANAENIPGAGQAATDGKSAEGSSETGESAKGAQGPAEKENAEK
jgi:preprotein translocase subunit SecG